MITTVTILVVLGILLMVMETFLPGLVAGILGALCVLTAVGVVMFSEDLAQWPDWSRGATAIGIIALAAFVQLVWLRWFAVRFWQRTFTLQASVPPAPLPRLPATGTEGLALTELRPLGRAEIAGERHEVRSEDGFMAAGSRLIVSGAEPGNLLVRRAVAAASQPAASSPSPTPIL